MNKFLTAAPAAALLVLVRPVGALEEISKMQNDKGTHGHRHHEHPNHSLSFRNVEEFAAKFDDPSRDEWQKPDEIFKFIGLRNGEKFADIGAGTGYFSIKAAAKLKNGVVYAVDSENQMLKHIQKRIRGLGLTNIRTCKTAHNRLVLPELVDTILIVNTYHHINERKDYFSKLKRWLVPGGKLIIVEGRPGTQMEPPPQLRVSADRIVAEMKDAGYELTDESDVLPYQSLQMFKLSSVEVKTVPLK